MGLCFATFVFLTFRGPLASHDSNPYPNRTRIARYNATKGNMMTLLSSNDCRPETRRHFWKKGKDLHPQDKSQYLLTLLRTPGRFTTRPLPVYFTTKMSVVRPFSVLSKDEIGP